MIPFSIIQGSPEFTMFLFNFSDGVRAVQGCKLHRQFEVSHRLLVEIEFMKMTSLILLLAGMNRMHKLSLLATIEDL